MPEGIFLVGWDDTMGSQIEAKFPQDCQIQYKNITQYLVTLQSVGKSSNVQIKDDNKIVLIYNHLEKEGVPNYEFIIVILDNSEESEVPKIQSQLNLEGGKILKISKFKRSKVFLDFAKNLTKSTKKKQKKIVFIGYPNSGKTTTKSFFFEQIQSEKLLETTFTPTKGIESTPYNLIDSKIVLFDTSGQEIERWFTIDETPLIGSDLSFFFITAMDWKQNSERVKSDLNRIIQFSETHDEITHDLVLFCHKFDEITEDQEGFKKNLLDFIQPLGIPVFFTSIKNSGNFDIHIGYQLMLRKLSPFFVFINNFLNPLMRKYTQSGHLLFMLDSDFAPISDFTHINEYFNVVDVNQFKKTIIKLVKMINLEVNNFGDFVSFSDKLSEKIVVCLRMSSFNPDFSYVIMQAESYQFVDELYKEYTKVKQSFSWITKKIE